MRESVQEWTDRVYNDPSYLLERAERWLGVAEHELAKQRPDREFAAMSRSRARQMSKRAEAILGGETVAPLAAGPR